MANLGFHAITLNTGCLRLFTVNNQFAIAVGKVKLLKVGSHLLPGAFLNIINKA
jgi:hypothetical protein